MPKLSNTTSCKIVTHFMSSQLREIMGKADYNYSKNLRKYIYNFMNNSGQDLIKILKNNKDLEISTFKACDKIKDFLYELVERRIFPSRSEAIRFITYYELIQKHQGDKEERKRIKEEEKLTTKIEKRIIKVLDNYKQKDYTFKKNKQPKILLNIYPRDLLKCLIVSFLNEHRFLSMKQLNDFLGSVSPLTRKYINKINEDYPDLIYHTTVKRGGKKGWYYNYRINRDKLERIINES